MKKRKYAYGTNSVGYAGLQKLPSVKVNSGADIASAAGSGAAAGASMGMVAGPWGAAIGAVGGALVGGGAALAAQSSQRDKRDEVNNYNKSVDFISGLSNTHDPTVALARHGSSGEGNIPGEIEGDGGEKGGIGEIVTDKNFNLKYVANGDPKHEQGGTKIKLKEGDVIFNTQSDKGKYTKILGDIKRYKMGDRSAGKRLESERQKLPDDTTPGYRKGVKKVDGPLTQEGEDYRSQFEGVFDQVGGSGASITQPLKTNPDAGDSVGQQNSVPGQPASAPKFVNYSKNDNLYNYKVNPVSGEVQFQRKTAPSDNWTSMRNTQGGNEALAYKRLTGKDYPTMTATDTIPVQSRGFPAYDGFQNPGIQAQPSSVVEDQSPELRLDQSPDTQPLSDEGNDIRMHNDPMKYALAARNLSQGLEPIDEIQRNYLQPEEYKYNDTSAGLRRNALEQRNFNTQRYQGIGMSRGQNQGTLGQVGVQYSKQMQDINEREYGRQQGVSQANTGLRNDFNRYNNEKADQYNQIDRQSRAVQSGKLDMAARDFSSFAQMNDQAKYMRDRNRRQYKMDDRIVDEGLLDSNYYKYNRRGGYTVK